VIRAEGNLGVGSSQEESFDDQESAIEQTLSVQPVNDEARQNPEIDENQPWRYLVRRLICKGQAPRIVQMPNG